MSSDLEQSIEAQVHSCRLELKLLVYEIQARKRHWQDMPQAVQTSWEYAQKHQDTVALAKEYAQAFKSFLDQHTYSYSQLENIAHKGRQFILLARAQAQQDQEQTMFLVLHSTIEQHIAAATAGLESIRASFEQILQQYQSLIDKVNLQDLMQDIFKLLMPPDPLSLKRLTELEFKLLEGVEKLKKDQKTVSKSHITFLQTQHFRIAIVEDDLSWQDDVKNTIQLLRDELGSAYQLDIICFDNVQDALDSLLVKTKSQINVQTLVVLDLALPKSPEERNAFIQKGHPPPDRQNGLDLLEKLRTYAVNKPVIILTTPRNLLADQLRVCQYGILDDDYILKGADIQKQLMSSLKRLIMRSKNHSIQISSEPTPKFVLDNVEIQLEPQQGEFLYALCDLCQYSANHYTLLEILNHWQALFSKKDDFMSAPKTEYAQSIKLARQRSGHWWKAAWLPQISNVMRFWTIKKAQENNNLVRALLNLREHDVMIWRDAMTLFELYQQANKHQSPWQGKTILDILCSNVLLAESIETIFGGITYQVNEKELNNLQNQIHEIRKKIQKVFPRYIEPGKEVLIRRLSNGHYGYRVLGDIVMNEYVSEKNHFQKSLKKNPFRILIVEDNPAQLMQIQNTLNMAQIDYVTATNTEDAVALAKASQPDLISLDMHIPYTREALENNVDYKYLDGGLKALSQIRDFLPDVEVVIPTTLYNDDLLRSQAIQLGVSIANFIPKGENEKTFNWTGVLLSKIFKCQQKISDNRLFVSTPDFPYPIIQIEKGSSLATGRLKLIVNGEKRVIQKSNQGKALALLLYHFGDVVSFQEIDDMIGSGDTGEARKQVIKNLRSKIKKEWFKELSPSNQEQSPLEQMILETVKDGYILHAVVSSLENLSDSIQPVFVRTSKLTCVSTLKC